MQINARHAEHTTTLLSLGSFIRNALIKSATVGVKVESSSLYMSSVGIEGSKYEGLYALLDHQQTLEVEECTIQSTQRAGVYVQRAGVYVRASNPSDDSVNCIVKIRGGVVGDANGRGVDIMVNGLEFLMQNVILLANDDSALRVQSRRGSIDISGVTCQASGNRYMFACFDLSLTKFLALTQTRYDASNVYVSILNNSLYICNSLF